MIIRNPGGLLAGLTVEDLYRSHPSASRNKGIASVFYNMGLIEQWGSGIESMREACKEAGIPDPVFEANHGFTVSFQKYIIPREHSLNPRQIKAVQYIREKGKINNKEYQNLTGASKATATNDLRELVELNIVKRIGKSGRGTGYILKENG